MVPIIIFLLLVGDMTKYIGFEDATSSGFTSEENLKNNPKLYEGFRKVFEVESDSWEEASHAWHQFQHGGSYNPICPGDCLIEDPEASGGCRRRLIGDSACPICQGKGWVTMEVWRAYKLQTEREV